MTHRLSLVALFAAAFALLSGPVSARCSKNLVQWGSGVQVASLDSFQLAADTSPNPATITFLGHSSYQIDTPHGVPAITDARALWRASSVTSATRANPKSTSLAWRAPVLTRCR